MHKFPGYEYLVSFAYFLSFNFHFFWSLFTSFVCCSLTSYCYFVDVVVAVVVVVVVYC